MKKTIYLGLCMITALLLSALGSRAQTITMHTVSTTPDSMCVGANIEVHTSVYSPSLTVVTFYGDGSSSTDTVAYGGTFGFVYLSHVYAAAGTYTLKHVLYNGTVAIDSATESYTYQHCNTFMLSAYHDANGNCNFDTATENYTPVTMTVEVDSAGTPIDTVTATSGLYYRVNGNPGTVYNFRILSVSGGVIVSCPASGIISFTVSSIVNAYTQQYYGMQCSGATGMDIYEHASARAGRHHFGSSILVGQSFCNPQNVTVTMKLSPKYNYQYAYPAPTSVTGHTVVWNLVGVSSISPVNITSGWEVPGSWLIAGDTVHSEYDVAPATGDSDPTNNHELVVDTVTSSYDPNEKEVSPAGDIAAGTKLTYTIHFENTGNDTAFNIHVLDTLSGNVDASSIKILGASARMNVSVYKAGTYTIAKFDFPNINLLDTSHHGQNTGMFLFSINSKAGLPHGTLINNRAGIYFDFNEVVLTNTVSNRIGFPSAVQVMSTGAAAVYPNPVSNELTINTGSEQYNTLTITNAVGQLMTSRALNGIIDRVDVKNLPAGTYFITLKGASGIKTQQFQKL